MAVRAKVESIARDVDLIISGMLSPEAQVKEFARFAREQRDEALIANEAAIGRRPEYETIVNGAHGVSEDRATVPGEIVYEFELGTELIRTIYDAVIQAAPVGTREKAGPKFKDSIIILADGVQVATPEEAAGAEDIIIAPTVAYARKLEGVRSKKYMSPQAPNGIFQAVATAIGPRYSNVASVKYTMESISGGATGLEGWAAKTSQTRKRFNPRTELKERARGEWNRRQPAIRIRFK